MHPQPAPPELPQEPGTVCPCLPGVLELPCVPVPVPNPTPAPAFPERHDDPAQAEELERQQDA